MRHDVVALFTGLCFIVLFLGCMWIWGLSKGWHADSPFDHDSVNTSLERFMPEPYGCNDVSVPGRNHTGCTSTWYYWKLPPPDANVTTRAVVWLFYSLHQIFIWGLIYRAQLTMESQEKGKGKYSTDLRWFNWAMLAVNALFIVVHLIQTHWTYDALAQDITVMSSQAAAVMMLCFILLMEYKDRGFMFMWPNPRSDDKAAKALRLHNGPIKLVRKYHGIAFAWAMIFTFWYHPMENTWGHTLGAFHTTIVLLQGSLAFTKIHLNRYWRLLNESWVFLHGTLVAIQTGDPKVKSADLWPIFAFGFGFVFAFTQIFSLPFWKKLPAWARLVPPVIYFAVVCSLCGTILTPAGGPSGFRHMHLLVLIPAQEYLQVLFTWLFLFVFIIVESKLVRTPTSESENRQKNASPHPSPTKQACYLCSVIFLYAVLILMCFFYEQGHYPINNVVAMVFFVFVFSLGICITIMLFKQLTGPHTSLIRRSKDKTRSNADGESKIATVYQNTNIEA